MTREPSCGRTVTTQGSRAGLQDQRAGPGVGALPADELQATRTGAHWAEVTDHCGVEVKVYELTQRRTYPHEFGRFRVDEKNAVLDSIPVRLQLLGYPGPPRIVRYVISDDKAVDQFGGHRVVIPR